MKFSSKKIAKWLLDNSKALFALSCLLFVLTAAGAYKFIFVTDLNHFFPDNNIYKVKLNELEQDFVSEDIVLIGLTPKKGSSQSMLSKENLQAGVDILNLSKEFPYAYFADSLMNARYSYANENGDLTVDELFADVDSYDDAELAKRIDYAKNDKILQGFMLSEDRKMIMTYVNIDWESGNRVDTLKEIKNYLAKMDQHLVENYPHLKLVYTGNVLLEDGMHTSAIYDLVTKMPLIIILSFIIMIVFFRSLALTSIAMSMVTIAIMMAFGVVCWFGVAQNQISLMASTLIMVLVLASAIHFIMNYVQFYQAEKDKYQALLKSYEINIKPVFFTVITTATGFLMINFTESPSFRILGNLACLGVLLGFFVLLFMMPFLLLNIPYKMPEKILDAHGFMEKVGVFAIKYKNVSFVIFTALIIFAGSFIADNKLKDDPFSYFDESMRFRQDTDKFAEHMAGRRQIKVALYSQEEGGINEPEFLRAAEGLSVWLEQQEGINKVYGYQDIIKALNKSMNGNQAAYDKLPETRGAAAELLLTYELDLPEGQNIEQYINYDKSAIMISVVVGLLSNEQMLDLEKKLNTWLDSNAPQYKYKITSNDLMYAELGKHVLERMTLGSIAAIILICLLLIVGLGSFKYGMLSFIPNALPAVIVYGFWGFFVGEVNMSVAVTFTIALGLVVDDTVHLLSKYLDAKRDGKSVVPALLYSYKTTGPALVLTTIVIVCGCVVQASSLFGVNAIVGTMTGLMVAIALIFDLLYLPPILLYLEKEKQSA